MPRFVFPQIIPEFLVFRQSLVGFTLIFMAVEVHSRYQISFYIPWVLLAGVGMNGLALLNERLIR